MNTTRVFKPLFYFLENNNVFTTEQTDLNTNYTGVLTTVLADNPDNNYGLVNNITTKLNTLENTVLAKINDNNSLINSFLISFVSYYEGLTETDSISDILQALSDDMTTNDETILTGGIYDTFFTNKYSVSLPSVSSGNTVPESY